MTEYDAVLFDNDGVLVAPPAHETQVEAARAAFRELGVEDVDRQHAVDVVAGVTADVLDDICEVYDLDADELWAAREHHDEQSQFDAFEAESRSRYDDVAAITDIPLPCGVVSNNHHTTVEFVLDFFDLDAAFDTYYGREKTVESLERKKPNPHYIERALDDLGAESALYVGDKETDVVAAHRAGADSAFVRRTHCADVSLSTEPTYEVETLHEVAAIVA